MSMTYSTHVGFYPNGIFDPKIFCLDFINKCLEFLSLENCISCISDHVQPISKPLSVVLAECGHFVVTNIHVVTWSVQEYSCTVLCYYVVCAGILLHCPVFTQGICLQSQNPLIYMHAHA